MFVEPGKEGSRISVIIPTKNEEATVGKVIEDVKKFTSEVVVADGHSKDRTVEIAKEKGIRVISDQKGGKGDGLKEAGKVAVGDILVFIDADGSHDARDIPKLVMPIVADKADLVIASRMLGGSDELHGTWSNFTRMVGASIICLIINKRWKIKLTDCENGFRAIKKEVFLDLGLKARGFDIEQEVVTKCLRKGYRVIEVPSHEYERAGGKSNLLVIKNAHKFLWRLLVDFF